ncbi:MAG: hypothetical protein AAGD01_15185 [Acidobacteriota bacterium]
MSEIDTFLSHRPRSDLYLEAIAYRASLFEQTGDLRRARQDFLAAHELSRPDSYSRYTLELSLGDLAERVGKEEEARGYYIQALRTVEADSKTSGATTILRLLQLKSFQDLSASEHALVRREIEQSWQLFDLAGEPDLIKIEDVLKTLLEAQSRP